MAASFANITPNARPDGILYADSVVLTSTEADLYNGTAISGQDPVQVNYGQAIVAVVKFVISGAPAANSTYVVMQTDLGDGTWIDVAWCFYSSTQVNQNFVLSGGGSGSINNAFQQSRQANSVPTPQTSGSNQMALGGQVRFVGRTVLGGGSSYSQGGFAGVRCTVTYKLLGN